jgi:hypothetical protein
MSSRAHGVASRQQRRARRRALRLRAIVGQPKPLARERIDPLGGHAAERPAAVAAQLAEAEVVDVKEQDVRPNSHAASRVDLAATGGTRHERGRRDQYRHRTAGDRASPARSDPKPGAASPRPFEPTTRGRTAPLDAWPSRSAGAGGCPLRRGASGRTCRATATPWFRWRRRRRARSRLCQPSAPSAGASPRASSPARPWRPCPRRRPRQARPYRHPGARPAP